MAVLTTNQLTAGATPTLGTDLTLISRDGVVIGQITLANLLNGLTSAVNTAAPNATVPVESFSATGTAANIDVAVVPKGTGAFSLQVSDNTTAGGNKRGTNAVDLQTSRTAATQVASGAGAFAAGRNNTASGTDSIAMGNNTRATGPGCISLGGNNVASGNGVGSICIGFGNSHSGTNAAAAIGVNNTVSGPGAGCMGSENNVSGADAFAIGKAVTSTVSGQMAFGHSSNLFGGYQTTLTGLRQVTTGTTATRATADAAAAAAGNQLTLRNNSVFKFMGRAVAYDLTTLDAKEWEFSGLIKRGAAAANTSFVGTPSVTSTFADTAAAAWTLAVATDTTNGSLAVNVTGAGANQIRWYIEVFAYETGV